MNEVIKKLSQSIDDDTMLLVMGDHGMTATGDHGGGSEDETEALLFAYSKQKPFVPTIYDKKIQKIQQIDFAPTLATILGVPIPFSNLGTVVLQLLPDVTTKHLQRHSLLLHHLWQNAQQIQKYFAKYSNENEKTFSYDDLETFESKFEVLELRVNSIFNDDAFLSFSGDVKKQLENLLENFRNIWIKFNPQLMTQGMLLVFLGVFVGFILTYNLPLSEFSKVFSNKIMVFAMATAVAFAVAGYFLHSALGWDDGIVASLFIASTWNAIVFGGLIIHHWIAIAENMSTMTKFINLVPRISFSFSILVFFSNSFIVQEQRILSYLLTAQVIHAMYELRKTSGILDFKGKLKLQLVAKSIFMKIAMISVGIVLLLRLSHNYFKCREEQGDCWDFTANSESEKKGNKMELIPVVVLAIFVTVARIFLKASGNLTGFSLHVVVTRFGPILSVIAASGHILLSQNQEKHVIVPQKHLDMVAWVVYAVFAMEVIVIFVSPLLIHIVPRNNDQVSVSNYANVIPELYRHVKNVFNQGTAAKPGQIPIIYGLATVYSSVFISLTAVFGVLLALLLGVKVSNGLVITATVGFGILFIFSVLRHESTDNVKECLQPHFALVVSWFLLVNFGFYATSHQPTISQIDWNSAFVGRAANTEHSNVVSATLVLLSTFNSNFLLLSIYPLLVLFPFMIYAIFPQLSMKIFSMDKKHKDEKTSDYRKITLNHADDEEATSPNRTDFDVTRGEINLFENEKLFMSSSLKVGCQLMILQGVKVFASMVACTILCRHLMVWKIFAPRFIYEGIGCYVSFLAIIFGFVVLMRIHVSVKSLVDKINKKS